MLAAAWAKLAGYGAAIGGVLLAILYIFNKGKKSARNKIKADTVDKIIDVSKKEKKIDKEVDTTSASDLRKRMREQYGSDAE